MGDQRYTLIINYACMQTGGIETWFSSLMLYAIEKKYRVIWLTNQYYIDTAHHREIADSAQVEKVIVSRRGLAWFVHGGIPFSPDEKVYMLSCDPLSFIRAESLRRETQAVSCFFHFLVLPHYRGRLYYPERGFGHNPVRGMWYSYMRRVVWKMEENCCLRAFSLRHLESYEENYGVVIHDKESKVLQSLIEKKELDRAYLEEKTRTRESAFTIVSCTRFDFPHKAYLLGLIEKFAEIKKTYPQLRLTIIGYGDGWDVLRQRIEPLPPEVKSDICLTGQLPIEEVEERFKAAHLNIGLAGAAGVGARAAVPTLLVRHYSESCETYGFYSSNTGQFLRDDAGQDIKPYIIRAIEASDEDYMALCRSEYKEAWSQIHTNRDYVFEQTNKTSKAIVSKPEAAAARALYVFDQIREHLIQRTAYDFEIV